MNKAHLRLLTLGMIAAFGLGLSAGALMTLALLTATGQLAP